MALQYTRTTGGESQQGAQHGAQDGAQQGGGQEVALYNVADARKQMDLELVNSKEVDEIVSTICVNDPQTIVEFGGKAAEEISKCSDQVLASVNMDQINDSGELLQTLGKIMDKFDIDEIAEEKKGLFNKLFGDMRKQLDQILTKYNTMGNEIDKIFVKLKQYEAEIKTSNQTLDKMFQANVGYYKDLVKYILAGEQGIKEIETMLAQMRAELEQTGDTSLQFDINSLEQAQMMLEQRTQDLRIAENVAMQTIPMIKTMQFSNLNLVRKINSAFIITLPIFKQALTQAVLLKRQKIQAEALKALDDRTNEMLLKNAQNTANQAKMTAQLASGSSIKIETLEETWKTIVSGIDETRRIQEEAGKKRQADIVRLQAMKTDFNNKMQGK